MKYFLDTEFHEYKKDGVDTIDLISIGIVDENGREFYAVSNEFDIDAAWKNAWLRENVLETMFNWHYSDGNLTLSVFKSLVAAGGVSRQEIAARIQAFVPTNTGVKPQFYGYYADYDWVVFCWLFGRMIDLPKGFPMYCRDLKQMYDEFEQPDMKDRGDYPKQEKEHNALDDAKWNLRLFQYLEGQQ